MDCSPPGSSVHGDSPDKNPGVGCPVLLQGIFPTMGPNPNHFTSPTLAGEFFTTSAPGKHPDSEWLDQKVLYKEQYFTTGIVKEEPQEVLVS